MNDERFRPFALLIASLPVFFISWSLSQLGHDWRSGYVCAIACMAVGWALIGLLSRWLGKPPTKNDSPGGQ
jgi:hypothetical protein